MNGMNVASATLNFVIPAGLIFVVTPLAATATLSTPPQSAERSVVETKISWIDAQAGRVANLGDNWDGYGADPVSLGTLGILTNFLREVLPAGAPEGSLVPGADGSIQAEWHLLSGSFGLLVEHDRNISAWMRQTGSGLDVEHSGLAALELLRSAALKAMA
jgi:hypothetical protein